MPLQVRITDNDVLLYEGQLQGPLEFGRQQQGELGPGSVAASSGVTRIVMASLDNKKVARRQLQATRSGANAVRLTNISTSVDVRIDQSSSLEAGGSGEAAGDGERCLGLAGKRRPDDIEHEAVADPAIHPHRQHGQAVGCLRQDDMAAL
ncbi:MAG: hypothetical protein ACKPJJ_23725, partial [Planctomycetaceae bacterium]